MSTTQNITAKKTMRKICNSRTAWIMSYCKKRISKHQIVILIIFIYIQLASTFHSHKQPEENKNKIQNLYEMSPPSMSLSANKHVRWSPLRLILVCALVIGPFCSSDPSLLFDFDKTGTGTVECLDNTWN